ncbi:MAG: glycoside hydrolase family 28 protein [Cyclobacteriaceae bacterium]
MNRLVSKHPLCLRRQEAHFQDRKAHRGSRSIKLLAKKLIFSILLVGSGFLSQAQNFYDVTKFGGKNDASEKATDAIKTAIAEASENGGGTVYFPAGEYLTGPIYLKSNITLFLDAGAYVRFSDDFEDYLPFVQSRYEGLMTKSFSPFIYAFEEENIAIVGRGTLDGQGTEWWHQAERLGGKGVKNYKYFDDYKKANQDTINQYSPYITKKGFLRPPFIQPMYCKNVRIEGVTIKNSPFWTVSPEFCENVTITGVTINNPHSPNTDGINPSSCKYVRISDCHISVGDDCITIKSGKDESGRMMNAAAEDYTITNCTMLSGHGGVVIGSEMSGGVKKITISNCVFDGTDRGIRIKSTRGRGGVVEDIRVDNVIMKDIKKEAIKLNMFYSKTELEPVSERTPIFRDIHFSNITAESNKAVVLIGLEEMPIENITFSDINFDSNEGVSVKDGKHIEFHNVTVNKNMGAAIEIETSSDVEIDGFKTYHHQEGRPSVELKETQDVFISGSRATKGTDVFLKVSGSSSKGIYVKGNFLSEAKTVVVISDEVNEAIPVD